MIQRKGFGLLLLVVMILGGRVACAQERPIYPAFTVVFQENKYHRSGHLLSSLTVTTYHSTNGDWRSTGSFGSYQGGQIYRRGQGVYTWDSRIGLLVKESDYAPGCPRTTAEELLRDPKFIRTESVLGFTTYILRKEPSAGLVEDTYRVPELGAFPFKRVSVFMDGSKVVDQPLSITLGEPSRADLEPPPYPVIEKKPLVCKDLMDRVVSKPDPIYPPEAQAWGISGWVSVRVIVDETGRVIYAASSSILPFLSEAANEAAYRASFSPTIKDGRPVEVEGILTYHFVLPQESKNQKQSQASN
jgi:TonB family protein